MARQLCQGFGRQSGKDEVCEGQRSELQGLNSNKRIKIWVSLCIFSSFLNVAKVTGPNQVRNLTHLDGVSP